MRTAFAGLLTLVLASTFMATNASAQSVVRWRDVVGVITAQGVDNPVCGTDAQGQCVGTTIHSGTFAWSARSGGAAINLTTGFAGFHVEGLVINGTQFSGTRGPIQQVEGTFVCNLGSNGEALLDTAPVNLSAQGDAVFSGRIAGLPASCNNPLFLIRIVSPAGALGRWIATGAQRTGTGMANNFDDDND